MLRLFPETTSATAGANLQKIPLDRTMPHCLCCEGCTEPDW
ncbi:hypothetical protein JMJ77_0005623, partial [Colletotrichum scovillei]